MREQLGRRKNSEFGVRNSFLIQLQYDKRYLQFFVVLDLLFHLDSDENLPDVQKLGIKRPRKIFNMLILVFVTAIY